MRKLLLSLTLMLLIVVGGISYQQLLTPLTPSEAVTYRLKPGTSLSRVAEDLQTAGVVRSANALKFFARWHDQGGEIQSGTYRFVTAATPEQILERLVAGDVEKVSLTIPEGFTQQQIFARIADKGYGDQKRLQQLATDPAFIKSLQLKATSLEGYLFPETYLFAPGIDEAELLRMMVNQFHKELDPVLLAKAKQHNLTLHQLVTLASIIEKETGKVDEMPLISSVFHNRLRRGIPLQTDPTVIYGIQNFDGNLTRKQLKSPTPYNTYTIHGLPPGPIASPGLAALRAAAEPAATDYLYFVARGDGSHQFSTTLKEHNRAVRRYQLEHRR
ncbi:MAG: endolytic transglycosylase MltG [Deltaproteobacteria bacterium]|nr:endolytic transglycosylase MltG [Deltaproteobacteria bacterium]